MSFILLGIMNSQAAAVLLKAGYISIGNTIGTIDKFEFPSDTRTTLAIGLSPDTRNQQIAGFANSGVAGYAAGGAFFDNATSSVFFTNKVDKFTFPADTRTILGTGLSTAKAAPGGFANSGVAGYVGGGVAAAGAFQTVVDKFAFPADTRTTLGTGLSSAEQADGMANSGVAGYFSISRTGTTGNGTVNKFAFPTDTRSTLGTGTSTTIFKTAGMANVGVAGYFAGGQGPGFPGLVDTVDRFAFPSDTKSSLGATLSIPKNFIAGMANSGVAGYLGGGNNGTTQVEKYAFPAETRSILGTGLSQNGTGGFGFADSGIL